MAIISQQIVDSYVQSILALRREYEFNTFWLGTRVLGQVTQDEALAIKSEINRRVGEAVERIAPDLLATPELPVMRINLQYPSGEATVMRLRPLLIYGRYRKLSREIPQSRWPCRYCGGTGRENPIPVLPGRRRRKLSKGSRDGGKNGHGVPDASSAAFQPCSKCAGTGRRFRTSVEEIVAAPILKISRAEATKMHSVGREDVDARMLGQGRPLVLEFVNPRVRTFPLQPIQEQINADFAADTAVQQLQFVEPAFLERMLAMHPDKSYRATAACLSEAPRAAVEALAGLRDHLLVQETPRRVLHRRPNLTRHRMVRECSVEILEGNALTVRRFALTVRAQSGTYIKEFISGDEGRTRRSVSALLGVPCDCVELDVLDVHADPLAEPSL